MSADNYLLVTKGHGSFEGGFPVFQLFASDEDVDLDELTPYFIGNTRDDALEWAHRWAQANVCEYGVSVTEEVWEARSQEKGQSE